MMAKSNDALPASPTLRARLKATLAFQGKTLSAWCRENGWHTAQLFMTLSNTREYPHIRDAMADLLRIPRSEVDRQLDKAA